MRFTHPSAYVCTIVYVSPTRCPREPPGRPSHFPFVFGEKIVGGRKTHSEQSISSVIGPEEDRVGDQRRGICTGGVGVSDKKKYIYIYVTT